MMKAELMRVSLVDFAIYSRPEFLIGSSLDADYDSPITHSVNKQTKRSTIKAKRTRSPDVCAALFSTV
jgi:hypothetical protein